MPAQVLGALPPAVSTRKTSCRRPVAPSLAESLSQGTAFSPCWPVGASAGALTAAFLLQGMTPSLRLSVSRVKKGVDLSVKKWWPLIT